jgi:AraC-like DNA-binding protein
MKEELESGYPKFYLYRRIVQAKLYMDSHFSEKIELNNIAGEAYFSKFHFIRLFRKAFAKTPHQYLISVRLEKARLLLAKGMQVSDVCLAVGFESVGTFTTLFKRIEKITPLVYQKRQMNRKAEIGKAPLKFIPYCFAEQKGWIKKSNFEEVPF